MEEKKAPKDKVNVIETGITISGAVISISTGTKMAQPYFPEFYDNLLYMAPFTQTNIIQQVGRVGRTTKGLSLCMLTKSTFEELEYSKKLVVTENMHLFVLKLAYSDSDAFKKCFVNTLDGFCFQNYTSSVS